MGKKREKNLKTQIQSTSISKCTKLDHNKGSESEVNDPNSISGSGMDI